MSEPRIINIEEKKLIGMSIKTSLVDNRTRLLWQGFMPRRMEIERVLNQDLYSVQVYPKGFKMHQFTPQSVFTRWAAVEVRGFADIPEDMETLILPGGTYAVFKYKGTVANFRGTARYIYGQWLPASAYELDDRPHFEILGKKYYGPDDPNSEEDVYIPIKSKYPSKELKAIRRRV
jgi:AraC family transcriptional regulator